MGVGTSCHSNVVAALPTVRSALGPCTLGCDFRVSVLADQTSRIKKVRKTKFLLRETYFSDTGLF